MTTQLVFPAQFGFLLTGTSAAGDTWASTALVVNTATITGNASGEYLYVNSATSTTPSFSGGAAGSLAGIPEILYVSLTGITGVTLTSVAAVPTLSVLHYTILFQITSTPNTALLTIANSSATILTTAGTIIPTTVSLTAGLNSVAQNPCARVISIGDYVITFTI